MSTAAASMETLQYILESLEPLWPKDELRPGLTLSYVDNGECYAAIVRWPRRDVKLVAVSCKAKSLPRALQELKARLVRFIAENRHLIPYIPDTNAPPPPIPAPPGSAIAVRR